MNIVLWVVQVLLGLAFIAAGSLKVSQPADKLKKNMNWVEDVTPTSVKGIGVLEILGGLGLILPAVTHILPWLTPSRRHWPGNHHDWCARLPPAPQ